MHQMKCVMFHLRRLDEPLDQVTLGAWELERLAVSGLNEKQDPEHQQVQLRSRFPEFPGSDGK